jgi:hypothetical protein
MATKRKSRHTFGTAEQLPSGRWQANYRHEGTRFISPTTYANKPALDLDNDNPGHVRVTRSVPGFSIAALPL